jgi:hypothetical protein
MLNYQECLIIIFLTIGVLLYYEGCNTDTFFSVLILS